MITSRHRQEHKRPRKERGHEEKGHVMVNVGKVSVIRDGGSPKERARKLVEEAAEAFSAWERFDRADADYDLAAIDDAEREILEECCDVITAACGLIWSIYGGDPDITADIDACWHRNQKRGRVMV